MDQRRDASGTILGLGIAIGAAWLMYYMVTLGSIWIIPAAPIGLVVLFGLYGAMESIQKVRRDDKGVRR